MSRLLATCSLAAVLSLLLVAVSAVDFNNPVRSAEEDSIGNLPGLNYTPNFKHYSGYLEADDDKNRFWHYWFVESRSNPDKDPLVLWLNGGPGCSSLLGLLTELGPYSIGSNGQLVDNPYSWNNHANVIFMESPAGVGFSYAVDRNVTANDDSTAKQNHRALRSFFKKFPQFKGRPLYLTGESYGGVYLPTLAVNVDQDPTMNLKGVAIGNGYLHARKLTEALIFFSYHHGLIGKTVWDGLSRHCCDGKPPARNQCSFLTPSRTDKCSSYVQMAAENILQEGINPYNLYDTCAQPDTNQLARSMTMDRQFSSGFTSREHFDKSLLRQSFNIANTTRRGGKKFSLGSTQNLRGDPPCTDDSITINYLNQPEVRKAIHIPEGLKTAFTTCFDGIDYTMQYPNSKDGLAPQMKKLIKSERKLNLIVYNGDTDMMCNFLGDEWFVDDLGQKVVADYRPWKVNNQVAGFVKVYDTIMYVTVRGSGHMVPTDRPAEALAMFENWLLRMQSSSLPITH